MRPTSGACSNTRPGPTPTSCPPAGRTPGTSSRRPRPSISCRPMTSSAAIAGAPWWIRLATSLASCSTATSRACPIDSCMARRPRGPSVSIPPRCSRRSAPCTARGRSSKSSRPHPQRTRGDAIASPTERFGLLRASVNPTSPTGADVTAKYKQYLFPSVATYYAEPVALESGKGCLVRDFDGKTYLDFFGGILTVSVGHANERVNAAVRAQVERLGHVSTLYPTLPLADLAEKLVLRSPGKLDRAFFCASGSEANETAVALAQAHTGRQELIALRHGYSGRTLLGQALTGHASYRQSTTQVAATKHAHAPYCYRCPFGLTYPSCELRCARDIDELIRTTTTGQVAALVAEPILGVGGVIAPPAGWMKLVVDIVRRYGGVVICDEVQTGFGRTGAMGGVDP